MRERGSRAKKQRQQGKQTHHDREEIIKRSEAEVGGGCGWSAAREGSKEGALDGGGCVIPAFAHARESCSRRSSPRTRNAVQGHRALSTSVGTRKFFASSSACTRPLSPSHSARHVATWLVNQPIANGRRRKMCEAGGHVVLAGAAGTLSPAP
jgi:hypothetical protein